MENLSESLLQQGYQLKAKVSLQDLLPFLKEQSKKPGLLLRVYQIGLIIGLMVSGFMLGQSLARLDSPEFILSFFVGLLAIIPIIPIHELLHALAYRVFGAKDIRFGANWKSLYFYAGAHRFIADQKSFPWIAFLPVGLITLAGLAAIPFVPGEIASGIVVFLTAHWLLSGGDFTLACLMLSSDREEWVTYDDLDEGTSYFFARETGN